MGFLCCFFLNGCHLSVKVMHQSPSQPCLSLQVGFCGCCIPRCSAKDGERCRHTASARTVAFSVLPVAASQCEDHHCCSWENWWRQELQIPQPWSLAHSCALPRGEGDCCQRIQVPSWASWIRAYQWSIIKHLHYVFTEVDCLDFVVLSSFWCRKMIQVFKLSVDTAVLSGCGFSMWQALGCQQMHEFVMSAKPAAQFSRTEHSVPDCQQM